MPPCQHDPSKPNPTVSQIDQSPTYVILYCSICKKTEINRDRKVGTPRPTPLPQSSPPVRRTNSLSSSSHGGSPQDLRYPKSAGSPAAASDSSDSDVQSVQSGIREIYAQLDAFRARAGNGMSSPDAPKRATPRVGMTPSPMSGDPVRPRPASDSRPPAPLRPGSSPPNKPNKGRESPKSAPPPVPKLPPVPPSSDKIPNIGKLEDSEKVKMLKYNPRTQKWTHTDGRMVIAATPFQKGNLRAAFHCVDVTIPGEPVHYVCKMSKDPDEDVKTYYADVEMQLKAQEIAEEFNKREPPKKVYFVDAFLIKCVQRKGEPILAVEPYMHGKYVKHSNNFGFVSKEDRNTPHAFSHFSYCFTQGQTLVCDIQGVDDFYTDPQIHSRDGKGYGLGNMGPKGMLKFFETHQCNAICRFLRLPPNKPKADDKGTLAPRELGRGALIMPPKMM